MSEKKEDSLVQEETHVEQQEQQEEQQKEQEQTLAPLFPVANFGNIQRALLNSMANPLANIGRQNLIPDFANNLPTFFNPFNSTDLLRQLQQQQNDDSSSDLAPRSSNSESPDSEAHVTSVEAKSKRSRKKRKEFAIEMGEVEPRKPRKRNLSVAPAAVSVKAADTESRTSENEKRSEQAFTCTPDFLKELINKYETTFNTLQSLSEEIKNHNLVPMFGQNNNMINLASEMKRELDMWKEVLPQAQLCVRRHRMSADDQEVANTILAYYKAHHPAEFSAVLSIVAVLYDKQERIIMNNFKKAMAKENAAKFAVLFQPDQNDSQRTGETSGSGHERVTNDDSPAINLSSLLSDVASTRNQDGSASSEQTALDTASQLSALLAPNGHQNTDVTNGKLIELCLKNSTTAACLSQIIAKVFENVSS